MEPSARKGFRREILEPLQARSPQWPGAWLGIPYREIQPLVLEMGRTDFRQGFVHPTYGALSPEDKVALYCFMNMRSHFYASLAIFDAFRAGIASLFGGTEPPLMIDLGCGPGTSGLAFGEHLAGEVSFDYAPVDIAPAMLERASSLFAAAKAAGCGSGSLGAYVVSGQAAHKRAMLNASYLFASETLDVTWLVTAVREAVATCEVVILVYTNSTDWRAGQKWQQFCDSVGLQNTAAEQTIEYRNSRGDLNARPLKFMRTVIRVR